MGEIITNVEHKPLTAYQQTYHWRVCLNWILLLPPLALAGGNGGREDRGRGCLCSADLQNKNCAPWAQEWIKKSLPGLKVDSGDVHAEIVKVTSVTGDCDLGQRKGK